MSGQICIYVGIALFVVSFILEIIMSAIFRISKKKTIKKIYEHYSE